MISTRRVTALLSNLIPKVLRKFRRQFASTAVLTNSGSPLRLETRCRSSTHGTIRPFSVSAMNHRRAFLGYWHTVCSAGASWRWACSCSTDSWLATGNRYLRLKIELEGRVLEAVWRRAGGTSPLQPDGYNDTVEGPSPGGPPLQVSPVLDPACRERCRTAAGRAPYYLKLSRPSRDPIGSGERQFRHRGRFHGKRYEVLPLQMVHV